MTSASDVPDVARAYAGHLLAGGVTSWETFLAAAGPVPAGGPADEDDRWRGAPPGAAQAELLRRLNRRSREAAPLPRAAAEHVLRRAAPGRGRVDLLLTDPPQRVPVAELLRVGAGVLADLVADLPDTPLPGAPTGPPRPRRGRGPSYRLEGPPLTVADLRRRLTAVGRPPGRRHPRLPRLPLRGRPDVVLVVALPLHRALVEVWSHRTQRGGTRTWPGTLAEWHGARRLPPGVAHDRLAAAWAARIGPGRVHVLTGPDLDGQVAAVLGRRPAPPLTEDGPALAPAPLPAPLPAPYVEVVRRASEVLTFRVAREDKQRRLDLLVGLLADAEGPSAGPGDALGLPPVTRSQQAWLARCGRRSAASLRTGGVVLHGPVAAPGRAGGRARPRAAFDRAVLAALLEAVLRVQRAGAGGRGETP